MSHFTVLVVGNDPEEQLKPFQENNMGDCPSEFMEFDDKEDEIIKEYNEGKDSDGPFNVQYSSLEEFAEEYHGYSERDEKKNRYGHWENPNAKWDWYLLGGRWTGFFQMKKNTPGNVGKPGLMTEVAIRGTADQAYKKDIDFESMRKKAHQEASDTYKMVEDEFNGTIPKIEFGWDDLMDDKNETYNKLDIKTKREMYHNQSAMLDWKSRAEKYQASSKIDKYFEKLYSIFVWEDPSDYSMSKEEYIQKHIDESISTFAIIMDGKWYEKGKMGWWAMVSDEKGDWAKEYSKLLDSVSEDTLLSVYDCHI